MKLNDNQRLWATVTSKCIAVIATALIIIIVMLVLYLGVDLNVIKEVIIDGIL